MRRIRSFQPDDRHGVLDQLSRTTQNAIAKTRSDDWLPIDRGLEVFNALVGVLGPERAVDFWRDVVYDSWVGGLLEPLITGARDSGKSTLTLAPEAWALSARDCGEIVLVHGEDRSLRLEARDLPPQLRESLGLQVLFAGALKAMLAFSKLDASVEIDAEGEGPLAFKLVFR